MNSPRNWSAGFCGQQRVRQWHAFGFRAAEPRGRVLPIGLDTDVRSSHKSQRGHPARGFQGARYFLKATVGTGSLVSKKRLLRKGMPLIVFSVFAPLLISCSRSSSKFDVVERLPELPAYLANNLAPTKIENVLMTKSPPPVNKVPAKSALMTKQQACTKKYAAYVVYPMTVCFPPTHLLGVAETDLAAATAQANPAGWSPASQATRYYKLSGSRIARFTPLFCRVSGGPWEAEVTTTESCDDLPDQSVLEIGDAPQPLTVQWSGGINDIPPPFNPNTFILVAAETCTCCSGFVQCPTGECVPIGVTCPNAPAVRQ
jgi:hypothetical protein